MQSASSRILIRGADPISFDDKPYDKSIPHYVKPEVYQKALVQGKQWSQAKLILHEGKRSPSNSIEWC